MALTGNLDDSSSEGSDEIIHQGETNGGVENRETSSPNNQDQEIELSRLTLENVNNQNTPATEVQVLNHPSNEGSSIGNNNDDTNSVASSQLGAGLLATFTGLIFGGPILAAIAGAGVAYAATKDDGPVGNAARSTGQWAVETGARIGEAAKEADEQHGILDRLKEALASGWGRVRRFDEEHRASERAKETLSDISEKTVEFEREHHVVENVLHGIQKGVQFLLDKLKGATEEHANDNSGGNSD